MARIFQSQLQAVKSISPIASVTLSIVGKGLRAPGGEVVES
jgi:hypothetical protein